MMLTPLTTASVQEIAPEGDHDKITTQVESLPAHQMLVAQGGFAVYLAKGDQIPDILDEIGRLREITFRAVGEGTGLSRDIDQYDTYYWHLFIWDMQEKRIAGGYRIGDGSMIYPKYGIDGFYISSLFVIEDGFGPVLNQCAELGRSFVIPSYQKKRLPLFLLWKGILFYLVEHPHLRYLTGPVSISKFYSELSKSVIVAFAKERYYDPENAQYIRPRQPFTVHLRDVNLQSALRDVEDINALENLLENIEPEYFKLPVLLKQYVRQNARFIGFNLDPNFSDALDGLMLLDFHDVRQETIENLSKSC